MPKQALYGLPWMGGKAAVAGSSTGTPRWLLGLLPTPQNTIGYCEPFAGMLGLLLARPKAHWETVNDLDGNVVAWWRAVRSEPEELARLLMGTPRSRTEYETALEALADPETPTLRRAWAFAVATLQGVQAAGGEPNRASKWRCRFADSSHSSMTAAAERLEGLAARLEDVVLEHMDACDLLAAVAARADAVIYCDPPYRNRAVGTDYGAGCDYERLEGLLLSARARVLLSGYPGEYPRLEEAGWRVHTHSTFDYANVQRAGSAGQSRAERVEAAWTNYPTPQATLPGF